MRVVSFSYKFGPIPHKKIDGTMNHVLILDVRTIANPYQHGLTDAEIRGIVLHQPLAQAFIALGEAHLLALPDPFDGPDAVVYVGCSYGRHRSVAIADAIASTLGIEAVHTSRGSNGKPVVS